MVDSHLFHGSPITRAFFKKPKANLLMKLKQWKIHDARRSQWIHQCEDDSCSILRDKPREIKTLSDRFSHLQAWSIDDETGLSATSSSPTSVLNYFFSCSKQVTQEEDNSSDDLSIKSTCSARQEPSREKDEISECPLCIEKMDETDLLFQPCSCGFKMCLFCYNTIYEGTGVCPGCRNKYDHQTSGVVSFQQRGCDSVPLSSSFHGLDSA